MFDCGKLSESHGESLALVRRLQKGAFKTIRRSRLRYNMRDNFDSRRMRMNGYQLQKQNSPCRLVIWLRAPQLKPLHPRCTHRLREHEEFLK